VGTTVKPLDVARSELIVGGQRSGKSRRAERLAQNWLSQSAAHRAIYLATARALDEEMQARIRFHQQERAQRVPGMATLEEARDLAAALTQHSAVDMLLVVDCLTLWQAQNTARDWQAQQEQLLDALAVCPGPVVLVSNEIGWGVIPLGREVRAFVDALGMLNQRVAAACQRVTLMAAGLSLTLKDEP